jgi:hypothetical protein
VGFDFAGRRDEKDAQSAFLKVIAATDPQTALVLLRNATGLSGYDSRDVSEMVFEKWAQVDPRQAAEAVAQLDDSLRRGASFAVAAKWAAVDLPSALAWARSQPSILSRFSLPESASTSDAITGVLQSWMVNDADGAMQWLAALPAGLERENLIHCATMMTDDPARGVELATLLTEGSKQVAALDSAIGSWVGFDPAGALTWATTQAEGPVRQTALEVGAARWLEMDRKSASEWIMGIPASPAKDTMLSDAVQIVVEGMPVGRSVWSASIDRMPGEAYRDMAQLIGGIGDPSRRDAAYEKLAKSWLRKNPEAARAWLKQSNISQSLKDRLLHPPATGAQK